MIGNVFKPSVMLMISGYLENGKNPFKSQVIRNALFTANGFMANTLVVKATGI